MGRRDELIATYADDLRKKCGMEPDMDLLTKVTIGCRPAIYNADASTVASSQETELETVKKNFLVKKLGLGKTICPSDAARALEQEEQAWRALMPKIREVAQSLAHDGQIAIYRKGRAIPDHDVRGVIRLGLPPPL